MVTKVSDLHSEKHSSVKTSTDAGRTILTNEVRRNACHSIRDNFEPDSNIIETSDLHSKKDRAAKTSTDAGRVISTKPVS
jgi:hypothetical protein